MGDGRKRRTKLASLVERWITIGLLESFVPTVDIFRFCALDLKKIACLILLELASLGGNFGISNDFKAFLEIFLVLTPQANSPSSGKILSAYLPQALTGVAVMVPRDETEGEYPNFHRDPAPLAAPTSSRRGMRLMSQ